MVNLGVRKVDDAVASKHPGLQQYAACQSAAFMRGTGAFVLGTAGFFATQKVLQKRLPYPLQWNLLFSVVVGSLCSYVVTRQETQRCSDLWVYLETGSYPDRDAPSLTSVTTALADTSFSVPEAEETSASSPGPKTTQYGDVME